MSELQDDVYFFIHRYSYIVQYMAVAKPKVIVAKLLFVPFNTLQYVMHMWSYIYYFIFIRQAKRQNI